MMRAMFYAPMASPDAGAASGVPQMGTLLMRALNGAGVEIIRPQLPRTYDGRGDGATQRTLNQASEQACRQLLEDISAGRSPKPDLWFSYHVYYKAPDWIGPRIARTLGIAYVVAEGSHAPKRAGGPWDFGYEGATAALRSADRVLAMTALDRVCLERLAPGRVRDLKPFIDASVFSEAAARDDAAPHLVAVGMMRNERKRASYAHLASALALIPDIPLKLTIAGDGVFRSDVEAMFRTASQRHAVRFAGEVAPESVPALLSSADIFSWPGIGEAFGLVFLEAQAAGVPVVACANRGVGDVTRDGESALLSAPDDAAAYAANLRRMLSDGELRKRFGAAGRRFVLKERTVEAASATLRDVLGELGRP